MYALKSYFLTWCCLFHVVYSATSGNIQDIKARLDNINNRNRQPGQNVNPNYGNQQ